jgi:hypothetical protein
MKMRCINDPTVVQQRLFGLGECSILPHRTTLSTYGREGQTIGVSPATIMDHNPRTCVLTEHEAGSFP